MIYSISEFAKRINVSISTLHRWDASGEFPAKKRLGGHRYYDESDVRKALNLTPEELRRVIVYCRVSSHGQKNYLESQINKVETYCLGAGIQVDVWIHEIGGGMNFKRKKFLALVNDIIAGEVKHLIVAHKDRLMRFGFDLFQHLAERHGCKIEVINQESLSPQEEMTEDLLAIVHTFSYRLYGMRKYSSKNMLGTQLKSNHGMRKDIVTRTLIAESHPDLVPIARIMGGMCIDNWHRYGALASTRDELIKFKSECAKRYGNLPVDGTIRNQTTIDTLNNIRATREAVKMLVKQAIFDRTGEDEEEEIRLFSLLERNKWTDDPFLHRQMRKHFKHGKTHNHNQFTVRSDKHSQNVVDGKLVITVHIAPKYDEDIRLVKNTTGEGVDLAGKNLRIILREKFVEIHYGFDKRKGRKSGSETIRVD